MERAQIGCPFSYQYVFFAEAILMYMCKRSEWTCPNQTKKLDYEWLASWNDTNEWTSVCVLCLLAIYTFLSKYLTIQISKLEYALLPSHFKPECCLIRSWVAIHVWLPPNKMLSETAWLIIVRKLCIACGGAHRVRGEAECSMKLHPLCYITYHHCPILYWFLLNMPSWPAYCCNNY